MNQFQRAGFIGLGVMGEPICRNLARKGRAARARLRHRFAPLARLAADGVTAADAAQIMRQCDIVFLSLPSGEVVDRLAHADDGLLAHARAGQLIVDLSTSPWTRPAPCPGPSPPGRRPSSTRRWRAPREAGTLSVMVGADPELFERARPLIATFATEITLCGPVGSGQVVKILNNMVLFETVVAVRGACHRASFRGGSAGAAGDFHARLRRQLRVAQPWRKGYSPRRISRESLPVDYARRTCAMRWPWLNRPAWKRWALTTWTAGSRWRWPRGMAAAISRSSAASSIRTREAPANLPHLPHESNRYSRHFRRRRRRRRRTGAGDGRRRRPAHRAHHAGRPVTRHGLLQEHPAAPDRLAGTRRAGGAARRRPPWGPTRITWAAPTKPLTASPRPSCRCSRRWWTRARKARPSMPTTTPSHGSACCGSIRIIPPWTASAPATCCRWTRRRRPPADRLSSRRRNAGPGRTGARLHGRARSQLRRRGQPRVRSRRRSLRRDLAVRP